MYCSVFVRSGVSNSGGEVSEEPACWGEPRTAGVCGCAAGVASTESRDAIAKHRLAPRISMKRRRETHRHSSTPRLYPNATLRATPVKDSTGREYVPPPILRQDCSLVNWTG